MLNFKATSNENIASNEQKASKSSHKSSSSGEFLAALLDSVRKNDSTRSSVNTSKNAFSSASTAANSQNNSMQAFNTNSAQRKQDGQETINARKDQGTNTKNSFENSINNVQNQANSAPSTQNQASTQSTNENKSSGDVSLKALLNEESSASARLDAQNKAANDAASANSASAQSASDGGFELAPGEEGTKVIANSPLAALISEDLSSQVASALITQPLSDESTSALESSPFMKLLGLLDELGGGENKLEKILSTEANISEIKNIKSLEDLIKIADKFGLNLGKISITNSDVSALKNEFKNLNLAGFFDNVEVSLSKANKKKIEQMLENSTKSEPKYNLAKLIAGVNEVKNAISNASEPLNLSKNAALNESLLANALQDKKSKTEPAKDLKSLLNGDEIKSIEPKAAIKEEIKPALKEQAPQEIKAEPNAPKTTINTLKTKPNEETIDSYLDAIAKKAAQNSANTASSAANAQNASLAQNASADASLDNFINALAPSNPNAQSTLNTNGGLNLEKTSAELAIKEAMINARLKNVSKDIQTTSVRSFAAEMVQKISEFKPPVTRIAMVLNPAELGEVSVTMISRANNLQVNITSNAQTMQLFVANQAEFKNSLVNMGYSDVQMNFADGRGQAGGGQNSAQNRGNARRAYEDDDVQINEIRSEDERTLEVVLPRYI